jgi:hypothetical protein
MMIYTLNITNISLLLHLHSIIIVLNSISIIILIMFIKIFIFTFLLQNVLLIELVLKISPQDTQCYY